MKTTNLPSDDRKKRALQEQARMIEICKNAETEFVEMGTRIIRFEEESLYKEIPDETGKPFKSMRKWMVATLQRSISYAYRARRAKMRLKGIPEEKLKEIPVVNLQYLAKLSAPQRKSAKWVTAAVDLSTKEFARKVNLVVMPSRQEEKHVTFVRSEVVSRALALAEKELAGHGSQQQCLEHALKVYLEAHKPKRKTRAA